MASVTMATSEWIQFFREAGIPPGPAVSYAVVFVDNRIQKNMLLDLNKEIMNELGITVVGDIIAILKHAKVVYRQEMCKAATDLLRPGSPSPPAEPRRGPSSAASRMIANSLSRESPPRPRPHGSKISVTVPNKALATVAGSHDGAGEEAVAPAAKRRRVTAEMEGKYIITMPKGTTPRTKKILEQQAARGLHRTSVFERLGAEAKADAGAGGKPTGVFSRLGEAPAAPDSAGAPEDGDGDRDGDGPALPYAGVLKRAPKPPPCRDRAAAVPRGGPVKAKATSSEAKPVPVPRGGGGGGSGGGAAQDGAVSSTRGRGGQPPPELRVTIRRPWGCGRVSSTSEGPPGAQMDSAGTVSVFRRLGRKPD